jgi:hypothetical protein
LNSIEIGKLNKYGRNLEMSQISVNTHVITLDKQKENQDFVWYKFNVNVLSNKCVITKKSEKTSADEYRHGVIKFQKTNTIEKTAYEIIKDETDKDLLHNPNFKDIIWACLYALFQCKRKRSYPDKTSYEC